LQKNDRNPSKHCIVVIARLQSIQTNHEKNLLAVIKSRYPPRPDPFIKGVT
jgi:hypothetical protein